MLAPGPRYYLNITEDHFCVDRKKFIALILVPFAMHIFDRLSGCILKLDLESSFSCMKLYFALIIEAMCAFGFPVSIHVRFSFIVTQILHN
jgi:hypothetical protein